MTGLSPPFYEIGKGAGTMSTLPHTCQHCKHWSPNEYTYLVGTCMKIGFYVPEAMAGVDTEEYKGPIEFVTKPSFGCNLWEDK